MADNVAITAGAGTTIGADEVVDGTLGTVKVQYVKIMDGTLDGTTKATVGANGLKVDGSGVTQPVSGTVTASNTAGDVASAATDSGNPVKVAGKFNSTQPTFTDGQRGDMQIDSRGNVRTMAMNGSNPASFGADNADAVAVSATSDKQRMIARLSVYNGTTWDRMSGDTTGINVKAIVGALPTGANAIGKLAANSGVVIGDVNAVQSGTWTVQPGNTANTTAWLMKTLPVSVSTQTALTTTATVSGSAGTYHGGTFINLNSVPSYIQVFDTAGAVTLGTTVPTFVQPIPANSTAANGAGFVEHIVGGVTVANGIKVAATTTATGASTSATALTGFITYR